MRTAAAGTSTPAASEASPTTLAVLVVAVTILWGANWPAMKLAVREFEPWTFRVISVLGAGATLLILARLAGEPILLERRLVLPHLAISFAGVTLWHMLTAYGLLWVGGGRAAIIAFTMPIWATLLSIVFLRERPTAMLGLALVLGTIGLAVLIGPDLARVGQEPLGALLILAAAFVWAVQTVATKAYDWRIGTMALSGWQLLAGGVPILLVWLWLGAWPDPQRVSLEGVLALLYVVFVALVFCFTTFLRIVRLLPAIAASLSTLAIPVVGVASSAWLLGEPVGLRELAALLLVLAAIGLVLVPRALAARRG
ncbi:MAG: DMT family transporter [Geminicoccaceae bacterium]|nr:DMT family transporter [Geminicoccaceae bacterium]